MAIVSPGDGRSNWNSVPRWPVWPPRRSFGGGRFSAPRNRISDESDRRAGRLAQHGHQMIVLSNAVDIEPALVGHAGGRRRGHERLDEHADRDQAVRKHEMRNGIATTATSAVRPPTRSPATTRKS